MRLCKSFLNPVVCCSFVYVRSLGSLDLRSGLSLAQGPSLTLPFLHIVCYKSNKRNICSCFFLLFFFLSSKEKEGVIAKSFAGVLFVFVFSLPPKLLPSFLLPLRLSVMSRQFATGTLFTVEVSLVGRGVSQCCMRQSRGSTLMALKYNHQPSYRSPHVHPAWKSLKSSSSSRSSTTTYSTI